MGCTKANSAHAGFFNSDGSQISVTNPLGPNPSGWLIIPATDSINNILNYAYSIQNSLDKIAISAQQYDLATGSGIFTVGLGSLGLKWIQDFVSEGSQEIQTGNLTIEGTPAIFVGAFTDAANYRFGLASAVTGIPETLAYLGAEGQTLLALCRS